MPKWPNQVGSLDFLRSVYSSSTSFFLGLPLSIKRVRNPVVNYHNESLLKQKYFKVVRHLSWYWWSWLEKKRVLLKSGVYSSLGFNKACIVCTFAIQSQKLYKWIDFFTQHSGTRLSECLSGGKTRLIWEVGDRTRWVRHRLWLFTGMWGSKFF